MSRKLEKINLKEINLSKYQKSNTQGSKSIIYKNTDTCIKLLTDLYPEEKEKLYDKLLELNKLKLNDVILPKTLIFKDNILEGYTMDYFKDSIPLADYRYNYKYMNSKQLFDIINRASLILRNIHEEQIICKDLSFDNILIDKNLNIKYCDIDGWLYNDNDGPYISALLEDFLFNIKNFSEIEITKETDKLSFILSFIYLVYGNTIPNIPSNEYQKRCTEQIKTLKSLKKCIKILIQEDNLPKNIPYMDQIINKKDSVIIDRVKMLNLK